MQNLPYNKFSIAQKKKKKTNSFDEHFFFTVVRLTIEKVSTFRVETLPQGSKIIINLSSVYNLIVPIQTKNQCITLCTFGK